MPCPHSNKVTGTCRGRRARFAVRDSTCLLVFQCQTRQAVSDLGHHNCPRTLTRCYTTKMLLLTSSHTCSLSMQTTLYDSGSTLRHFDWLLNGPLQSDWLLIEFLLLNQLDWLLSAPLQLKPFDWLETRLRLPQNIERPRKPHYRKTRHAQKHRK